MKKNESIKEGFSPNYQQMIDQQIKKFKVESEYQVLQKKMQKMNLNQYFH